MATIEAISTTYLEANAASVTFSSIPSTFEHLQLRINARTDYNDELDWWSIQLNGDTGTNYAWHRMEGAGSSTAVGKTAATNAMAVGAGIAGGAGESAIYGITIIDVLDYANTNKNTTLRLAGGVNAATAGDNRALFSSGLWVSTAAVTSILLDPQGGNLVRGSEFTLYGLKST